MSTGCCKLCSSPLFLSDPQCLSSTVSPSDPCEVRPMCASWEMFCNAGEVDIHFGFSFSHW